MKIIFKGVKRARYYDPGTGRFLREDPIGFQGKDSNFYRYVGNKPTISNDPYGLFVIVVVPTEVLPEPAPADPHTSTPLEKGGYLFYKDSQYSSQPEKDQNFDNFWKNVVEGEDNEYNHLSCPKG